MASPTNTVRHRGGQSSKKASPAVAAAQEKALDTIAAAQNTLASSQSEWDYKLALVVITGLAFLTRFWGIDHPNEVVFDEVHFGKVRPYHTLFQSMACYCIHIAKAMPKEEKKS